MPVLRNESSMKTMKVTMIWIFGNATYNCLSGIYVFGYCSSERCKMSKRALIFEFLILISSEIFYISAPFD